MHASCRIPFVCDVATSTPGTSSSHTHRFLEHSWSTSLVRVLPNCAAAHNASEPPAPPTHQRALPDRPSAGEGRPRNQFVQSHHCNVSQNRAPQRVGNTPAAPSQPTAEGRIAAARHQRCCRSAPGPARGAAACMHGGIPPHPPGCAVEPRRQCMEDNCCADAAAARKPRNQRLPPVLHLHCRNVYPVVTKIWST